MAMELDVSKAGYVALTVGVLLLVPGCTDTGGGAGGVYSDDSGYSSSDDTESENEDLRSENESLREENEDLQSEKDAMSEEDY